MRSLSLLAPALLLGVVLPSSCIIHIDGGRDWTDAYVDDGQSRDGRHPIVRGNGTRASEAREVGEFDTVRLAGWLDLQIRSGEARSVTVKGDENIVPRVRTDVQEGTLEVWVEPGRYRTERPLVVEIGVPDLAAFALAGSGDASIEGVDRDDFALSIDGSGDVSASGRVEHLTVAINGSGDMRLDELHARTASVTIAGSGDVRLSVSDDLAVGISGSGDVVYRGDPAVRSNVHGSGDVRRRRE